MFDDTLQMSNMFRKIYAPQRQSGQQNNGKSLNELLNNTKRTKNATAFVV